MGIIDTVFPDPVMALAMRSRRARMTGIDPF